MKSRHSASIFFPLIALPLLISGCSNDPSGPYHDLTAIRASFSYSGQTVAPARIIFTNRSVNGRQFHWDFGDGRTLDEAVPRPMTFSPSGEYLVTLVAMDTATARADTASAILTITPGGPYLDSLKLHAMWWEKRQRVGWDEDGSGPDLFLRIYSADGEIVRYPWYPYEFPVYGNLATYALPVHWRWLTTMPIVPGPYSIYLFDYDGVDERGREMLDTITTFRFTLPELEGEVADTVSQDLLNRRLDGSFAELELVWKWI